ncbi:hypothetical protein J6590_008425 [Homalodisca vitripennis]|nr:hypothetical protein J6590_008425 [Homalodisca vitripennis]
MVELAMLVTVEMSTAASFPTGLSRLDTPPRGMIRLRMASQVLSTQLRPHSGLPTDTKLLLYKTIVRPIVTYVVPAWYSHTSKMIKTTLEAFQNWTDAPLTDKYTVVRQERGHSTVCKDTNPA